MKKTNVKRAIAAVKVAGELGIQDVSPILKNISIPCSRLYIQQEGGNEEILPQDSLKHVGSALAHHGMVKYTNQNGETFITKDCPAVRAELGKAGYTVLYADLAFDQKSTEVAISKARGSIDTLGRGRGYGLSEETIEAIDELERDDRTVCKSGYVPFGGMLYDLGKSTSMEDASLLMAFNHYPVPNTSQAFRSAESIETVEALLIANMSEIKKNFSDYEFNAYAQPKAAPIGEATDEMGD